MKSSKKDIKANRGITLIALVVTIIVLLILAGVAIATLTGDNGLLTKAGDARNRSIDAEIEEEIGLAWIKVYSDDPRNKYTADQKASALQAELRGKDNTATVKANGSKLNVSYRGKDKVLDVSTGTVKEPSAVAIAPEKWKQNEDGSYSKGSMTIQIGDIVNYNELSNGAKSYTTDTSKGIGGSVGTKDSTTKKCPINEKTYTTEDLTWRVLGVNESGQIELIGENPISKDVYLANEEGYLYGPSALNTMCDKLYGKGTGAESARSLNVDDVDKLAEITTDADKKAFSSSYGSKWHYRYPTTEEVRGTRYMQYRKDTGSGYGSWTNTDSSYQTFRMPGESTTINSTNPGYSPELTDTYYYYSISSKVNKTAKDGTSMADLLVKGTTSGDINQWMASSCVLCYRSQACFGVRVISSGAVNDSSLFDSDSESYYYYGRVRPVVTLESDIQLSGDSTNGWTIQ